MKDAALDRRAEDGMYAERAATYAMLYPRLREVARQHGYALALHGTLEKDLDVLACPWVEGASDADALAEALRDRLGGAFAGGPEHHGSVKPHGRRAWTILLLGSAGYVDLSVMPLVAG